MEHVPPAHHLSNRYLGVAGRIPCLARGLFRRLKVTLGEPQRTPWESSRVHETRILPTGLGAASPHVECHSVLALWVPCIAPLWTAARPRKLTGLAWIWKNNEL